MHWCRTQICCLTRTTCYDLTETLLEVVTHSTVRVSTQYPFVRKFAAHHNPDIISFGIRCCALRCLFLNPWHSTSPTDTLHHSWTRTSCVASYSVTAYA